MSYFIADGFDVYSSVADAISVNGANGWNGGNGGGVFSSTTRWAVGRSWYFNNQNGVHFIKDGGPNQSTWIIHVAFWQTGIAASGVGDYIILRDGGTAQCSICFNPNGNIDFRTGSDIGSVAATWSSAFVSGEFSSYQFKIIINNTTGEVHARKNGAVMDSFSSTGINTRGGTTNNFANGVAIAHSAGTQTQVIDDFFCCYDDGVYPRDWMGDIRAIQLQPLTDTAQLQFAPISTGSLAFGQSDSSTTSGGSISANHLYTNSAGVATQGGVFTSVTAVINAGFTGNVKYALYICDGNVAGLASDSSPGTLVAVSNTLVNPSTGNNTVTFPNPVPVKKGFLYYWGILSDTAFTHKTSGAVGLIQTYDYVTSYAGGFPSSLTGLTGTSLGTNRPYSVFCTLTQNNAGCVNDELEDGGTTFLKDNAVGDFDLFDLGDLNYVPISVIGATFRSMVCKSDAGARGFEMAGKSGGTSFVTNEYQPLTGFSYTHQFYPNDPNTSAPWSSAALNALQGGPKVSS